jgi:hypothetical protein
MSLPVDEYRPRLPRGFAPPGVRALVACFAMYSEKDLRMADKAFAFDPVDSIVSSGP